MGGCGSSCGSPLTDEEESGVIGVVVGSWFGAATCAPSRGPMRRRGAMHVGDDAAPARQSWRIIDAAVRARAQAPFERRQELAVQVVAPLNPWGPRGEKHHLRSESGPGIARRVCVAWLRLAR